MQCPDFLLLSKFVFSSEWEYPAQQHATYAIVYSALFPWAEIVLFWLTFPYIYFYPSLHALLYCALLTDISMAHRPTAFTGPTLTQPLSLTPSPTFINDPQFLSAIYPTSIIASTKIITAQIKTFRSYSVWSMWPNLEHMTYVDRNTWPSRGWSTWLTIKSAVN